MIIIGQIEISDILIGDTNKSATIFVGENNKPIFGGNEINQEKTPILIVDQQSIDVLGNAPYQQSFSINARIDNNDGAYSIHYEYPNKPYINSDGPSFIINSQSVVNETFIINVNMMKDNAIISSKPVSVNVFIKAATIKL